MTDSFTITKPDDPSAALPMVVHIPHAGTAIPSDVRERMRISDELLADEVMAMTDWFTDELFGPVAADAGATVITNHVSRLVVDPERLPNHLEPMADIGMGAVYTHTRHGTPMRTKADTPALLDRFFQPWAEAVDAEVNACLARFGTCLLLDGHSFPDRPFPFEDPSLQRPDIDIGWSDPHCPEELLTTVRATVARHGRSVAENTPFSGVYVPLHRYGQDPRVKALMIEVNRKLYLDKERGAKSLGWSDTTTLVNAIVSDAVRWAEQRR